MSKQTGTPKQDKQGEQDQVKPYLDHGVPSLVAMDNPDDFPFRDEKAPKRGSRR